MSDEFVLLKVKTFDALLEFAVAACLECCEIPKEGCIFRELYKAHKGIDDCWQVLT